MLLLSPSSTFSVFLFLVVILAYPPFFNLLIQPIILNNRITFPPFLTAPVIDLFPFILVVTGELRKIVAGTNPIKYYGQRIIRIVLSFRTILMITKNMRRIVETFVLSLHFREACLCTSAFGIAFHSTFGL